MKRYQQIIMMKKVKKSYKNKFCKQTLGGLERWVASRGRLERPWLAWSDQKEKISDSEVEWDTCQQTLLLKKGLVAERPPS